MKKIKTLLTMLLCAVMVFGMPFCVTNVPVNAEVIEEDKPKKVEFNCYTDKKVYHIGDKVSFFVKITNLSEEECKEINGFSVNIDFYDKVINEFRNFNAEFKYIDNNTYEFISKENQYTELEETISFGVNNSDIKFNIDNFYEKYELNSTLNYSFIINNNCADGIHTVYKDDWQTRIKATCDNDGEEVRYCHICNEIADRRTIPKLTLHDNLPWHISEKATCTKDGEEIQYCNQCNKVINKRAIPKIPHEDGDSSIWTYPDCEKTGEKIIYCKYCNQPIKKIILPAREHTFVWEIRENPTYNKNGYKVYVCLNCNKIIKKEIIAKLKRPYTKTTQLKFTKKLITLKKGKVTTLKYIRKPLNARDKLFWKSSNSKIVKVLKNGKIKAVKKGKTIITLSTNTGKKTKITIKIK